MKFVRASIIGLLVGLVMASFLLTFKGAGIAFTNYHRIAETFTASTDGTITQRLYASWRIGYLALSMASPVFFVMSFIICVPSLTFIIVLTVWRAIKGNLNLGRALTNALLTLSLVAAAPVALLTRVYTNTPTTMATSWIQALAQQDTWIQATLILSGPVLVIILMYRLYRLRRRPIPIPRGVLVGHKMSPCSTWWGTMSFDWRHRDSAPHRTFVDNQTGQILGEVGLDWNAGKSVEEITIYLDTPWGRKEATYPFDEGFSPLKCGDLEVNYTVDSSPWPWPLRRRGLRRVNVSVCIHRDFEPVSLPGFEHVIIFFPVRGRGGQR